MNDDDDEHDDRDQNGHNLANFQAKCSKFCMAIHPVSTYRLMIMILMILTMIMMMIMKMIMMMIMNMMIEIKMAITRPIFKLSDPNFAWQFIQFVPID